MAKKPSLTAKRIYRKRVSRSPCRGKTKKNCGVTKGCKNAKGKKRTFCRKKVNTKRKERPAFRVTYRRRK
tara:strand:+ start:234 stop:443 length:210 start_codon:yes stop_codon:yes gene_type:complete